MCKTALKDKQTGNVQNIFFVKPVSYSLGRGRGVLWLLYSLLTWGNAGLAFV